MADEFTGTDPTPTPAAPVTPAEDSATTSLVQYREARANMEADAAAPTTAVSPDQEADSSRPDPDVSEAARQLRRSRLDERKKVIQAEISELVRQRNDLRREARASAPAAPPPPAFDPGLPPEIASWDGYSATHPAATYEDFTDARIDYRAERKVESRLAAERAAYHTQVIAQTYASRADAYAAEHPDFQEALASADDVDFPADAIRKIAEQPMGPAIAHYLATHRDVATRVANLPPDDLYLALED